MQQHQPAVGGLGVRLRLRPDLRLQRVRERGDAPRRARRAQRRLGADRRRLQRLDGPPERRWQGPARLLAVRASIGFVDEVSRSRNHARKTRGRGTQKRCGTPGWPDLDPYARARMQG
ncbi:hypothetical protein GCM10009802_44150 [Streptomyces synnematoformans]|uniref:Uncharacterized protein n=1 Tax=Streptomyces synnematoformans TaxID=415721 RepID=A0ABP5KSH8_9ACTN